MLYNGIKGLLKEGWHLSLSISLVIGFTLLISANYLTPYLASTIAGIFGLVFGGFVLPRIFHYDKSKVDNEDIKNTKTAQKVNFHIAFAPYYILIIIVFIVYLTPLKAILSPVKIGLSFPETSTILVFTNKATVSYHPFQFLLRPGTLILITIFYFYIVL